MYRGLPVVATDNRGHGTIIRDGENGFLVRIGESGKMAQRVLEIAENPRLRERLSHADVSRYSAEAVSRQIVEILTNV